MRREIPLAITLIVGMIMLLSNFVEIGQDRILQRWSSDLGGWVIVVTAFAVGLATVNLLKVHVNNISRRRTGWVNSVILITGLVGYAFVGIIANTLSPDNEPLKNLYQNVFDHVMSPLGAALFAVLAFYIASASYRAFRMRSLEASVLLVAAIVVMLGKAPIGELIWSRFPTISEWLLNVANTAGQRGIMMGAAIGAFATSLRVLLGIERGHLGSE